MTAAARPGERVALLETDWQPWILALAHDPGVVARGRAVRAHWRRRGALVICGRYVSRDAGDALRADVRGEGARFLPGFEPTPVDLVQSKHGTDAFDHPDLRDHLELRGIRHLVIDGLLTDGGVRAAGLTALGLGYRVTVEAGACAGSSLAAHRSALEALRHAGAEVRGLGAAGRAPGDRSA